MFKMFGENNTYAYLVLVVLLLAIPFSMLGKILDHIYEDK